MCLLHAQDRGVADGSVFTGDHVFTLPYFAVCNAHFFAQIFEEKMRMRIIHG